MDLSPLDRPEALEIIFPIVYSAIPMFNHPASLNALSYQIEVEEGVNIECGFWPKNKENPTILYFHGNGEVVADHDWIAPFYNQRGINLFVADYRGYGSSEGMPTISNMYRDAHTIFNGFKEIINKEGFKESPFVMGRSLGSLPAVEIASHYQDDICGLIVESGTANNFRRLWNSLGINEEEVTSEEGSFLNKVKVRHIHKPTLVIHGEFDQVISVSDGKELYQNSGATDRQLLIIPGADHNDVMTVKPDLYFDTIAEFIAKHS